MTEERLMNIESKITYLEDSVQELNSAVYQQQKQIDQLQALCESLLTHMQELSATTGEDGANSERPPHY